ncbi:hypothetical protein [Halobaculum sp. P14]|uniref:hypothetical protein n=1 Tax=Halobaculum sp. P14 TaxID=3421638 RepID=UPI003EBEC05B
MTDEDLLNQLTHHWDHVRHIDKIRYSSTNIYSGVILGLITISTGFPTFQIPLLLTVTFVSIVGITTHLKLGLEYYQWASHAIFIEEQIGVDGVSAKPSGLYGNEYNQTLMSVLSKILTSPVDLFSPDEVATTEVLSPSHWQMSLQIIGLSLAVTWLLAILFERYLGQNDILSILAFSTSFSVLLLWVVYRYAHLKIEAIDSRIDSLGDKEITSVNRRSGEQSSEGVESETDAATSTEDG